MRALIVVLFFLPILCFGQVGINTTSPNASLDIQSSNIATPINTDGILIPKIDEYPITNPTVAQDGMLVFVTGNGSVTKGFYYWEQSTTSWQSIGKNAGWSKTGNSGTNSSTDFIGTTDAQDLTFRTNNTSKMLLTQKGQLEFFNTGSSVFIGEDSGASDDLTNNFNTFIGSSSGQNNIIGMLNSFFGYSSGRNNLDGMQNSFFGSFSGQDNTSGSANSFIGYSSGSQNTSGSSNSFFGFHSGFSNSTGIENSFFGLSSGLRNTLGDSNVAIGYDALALNQTGSRNVAIGNHAGRGISLHSKSNSIFIGHQAGMNETNSNRLYIENSSSTSPLIYGEFDLHLLRVNGDLEVLKTANSTLKVKTDDGNSSSLSLLEGTDYGFEFLYTGSDDKLNLWSRTFAGNEGERMTWLKDGKVGMNDTSPDARLDIEATNPVLPTNTDGILIPRVDTFPSANPGANQNGMLVFLTTDNSFYYWRNSSSSWQKISTVERINDLMDGKSDNDGSNNGSSIFLGVNAGLTDNSSDNRNVAIGYQASEDNLVGNNNTAIGYQSLHSNRVDYNVAIGNKALFSTIVGNQNTAIGYATLELNTGRYNTAVGYIALQSNTNGDGNTTLGNQALSSNTNGDNNVAIGYRSMLDNSTGGNNVAMGYHALQNNISGDSNVAIGGAASYIITTGSSNTAIGQGATALAANFYNTSAIGAGATPNSPNQVRLGNASVSVIGGYAAWSHFSDERLKTNIKEDVVGLDFIKKLRPVSYNYDMDAIARFDKTPDSLRLRDAERLKAQEIQTGFIAQEVEAVANDVGFDFHGVVKPYDNNGTYALRYAEFVVPLVKAMQEQQEIIDSQQKEIKTLKREMEEIKSLLRQD